MGISKPFKVKLITIVRSIYRFPYFVSGQLCRSLDFRPSSTKKKVSTSFNTTNRRENPVKFGENYDRE